MSEFPPLPPGYKIEAAPPLPPGFSMPKEKYPGDELGDTAAIMGGAFTQGAREGGNPLGIIEGIMRLGQSALPYANPVADTAMKQIGADKLIASVADWLERNKSAVDPLKSWAGKPEIADAFKDVTGLDPRTDLATKEAAYKATGAEKTTLREALAAGSRVIGATVPMMGIPGMSGPGMLRATGLSALGAGAGNAVAGEKGEVVGQLLALLANPALSGATRGVLRGTSGDKTAELIRDFERAGTTPSMGQVTGSHALSGVESTTGRFGAVSHMQKFGEKQAAQMGERIEDIATGYSPSMDKTQLGRYVREGISGKGGFIERTEKKVEKLYSDVDKKIPPETPITMANVMAYLQQSTANPRGSGIVTAASEEATKRLTPYLEGINTDLIKGRGYIPYQDVTLARTRIGKKIDQSLLNGDVTVQEAKGLYAALTKDIEQSLAANPGALRAWQKATGYYRARMDRLEQTLVPLIENKTPERIITALDTSKKEGSTVVRSLYKSLDADQRNMMTGYNIRQLGRAGPGAQNAEGNIFSPALFVTRWNRLDDGAKRVMFSGTGNEDLRFALDSFARTADAIKKGSTVLQNKSGTAAAVYNLAAWVGGPAGGGVLGSLLAGAPGAAAGIATSWMTMNRLGHLMTNPAAVRWLARSTTMPAERWAVMGQGLAARYPEHKEAIEGILTSPTGR